MSDDQTPILPHRTPMESAGVDAVWFHSWRREIMDVLKEARREMADGMQRVDHRLVGIEGRLSDGQRLLDKHTDQLSELIGHVNEVDTRVRGLEDREASDARNRIEQLEIVERERTIAERTGSGLWRTVLVSALCTAIGAIVLGVVAIGWWILTEYIHKGKP